MSATGQDWKKKYLSALKLQEKQEQKFRQVSGLLSKGLTRMSLVVDGMDSQLDKQMGGLRKILREDNISAKDLNLMVSALEGQVKRIDMVKEQRAKVMHESMSQLSKQLKGLKPPPELKKQIKTFEKDLKVRSKKMQEYTALVSEFTALQKTVIAGIEPEAVGGSLWNKLFSRSAKSAQEPVLVEHDEFSIEEDTVSEEESVIINGKRETVVLLADDIDVPLNPRASVPDRSEAEPTFNRLSPAISSILAELLQQVEPPKLAKDNYAAAKAQLEKGLTWYDLVPTLENISIVIISAIHRDQQEFSQFLLELNQRLANAYAYIDASQKFHEQGIEAGERLSTAVRDQVSAMQESVEQASELDQLKSEVSSRLDQIVSAMDQHQSTEKTREESLSEQLNQLVERVKNMEAESAEAEQKIEEQRQLALRDVLTQLPNREGYQQRLEQEFGRWQRYQRPLSMVVCDIDHFKQINDNYGHLAGDKVLRIIAKTLSKRLRKTDYIARYGGEEFVILLPETTEKQGFEVVDGVREAIASCPFHFKEKPVSITMSFGVTEFKGEDKPDQVFERADKALYKAKDSGRNCCILAE